MKEYLEQVSGNFNCPPLGFLIGIGIPFLTVGCMSIAGVSKPILSLWVSIPCIMVGVFCLSIPLWIHRCMTLRK